MRVVCFVSDRTGLTAETLGHSLLSQFDGPDWRYVTIPFVNSIAEAEAAVARINAIAVEETTRPIILSTLVDDAVRGVVRDGAHGLFLDFFDAFLAPLEAELQVRSAHVMGKQADGSDPAHSTRIMATNYALANDDGAGARDYGSADVILMGVSRSSKTPTSLYMALQYGIFAANYPLTDEDLDSTRLPTVLQPHRDKLFGLTIVPERLQQIRSERRPGSRYASSQQVQFEVRAALALFERNGVPHIDVSECSVEEIASRILDRLHLDRRMRK